MFSNTPDSSSSSGGSGTTVVLAPQPGLGLSAGYVLGSRCRVVTFVARARVLVHRTTYVQSQNPNN